MTQEQQKHLRTKLQYVYAAKMAKIPSKYGALPKFPKHIALAARLEKKYETIVSRWKAGQYKKNEGKRNEVEQLRNKVETLILFGTPEQAMTAIETFERRAL